MLNALEPLPEDANELRHVTQLLAKEVKSQALMIEKLKAQLSAHNKVRFGSKGESLDQLMLGLLEDEEVGSAAEVQKTSPDTNDDADDCEQSVKRRHSRTPLPDHLERQDEVLLSGEACDDCGGSLKQLGEDVTEELEYIPG